MSLKSIRPTRVLALIAVLAAFLATPALAGAATHSMKWAKSVLLENPNRGGGLDAIGCAPRVAGSKALMCVAGDVKGNVFASIHPARSAHAWRRETIDPKVAITGVACPAINLCVAVDANGAVSHAVHPLAGVKAWSKPVQIDTATQTGGGYAGFSAIACPTTTFCLAVDNAANGQVAYTTDPTGPASAWTLTTIGSGVTLNSVACATAALCLIGGTEGYYSVQPTGGATAWKAMTSLSSSPSVIASLACNTVKLCIGVGYGNSGAGLALGSSTPTTTTWSAALIGTNPPAQNAGVADSVACPQRNFCVAVDSASNAYTTTSPVRGHWSVARPLKRASQSTVSQISCNTTLCIEVDNRGTVTYGVVKSSGKPATTPPSKTTTTTTTKTTPPATGTTTGTTTTGTTTG